jgi:hypothetical protein
VSARFRYLRDPLFLTCVAAYVLNRFVVRPLWPTFTFARSYLNDFLCIPFWLPGLLFVYRKLGLRKHDDPPQSGEVLTLLIAWSVWFEVLAPVLPPFRGRTVADPWDVAAYSWGALIAMLFWHRRALWKAKGRLQ